MTLTKTRVVVVGGGTGTYTLLRGLKRYSDRLDITAIVTMADSGGSTGRLRDEFGQLPVGDVRQALAALSTDISGSPNLLRDLFLYRFSKGEGLSGHNFGNLFLTALTDILGSEAAAIEAAGTLLRVSGKVLPVTTEQTHLEATYQSGRVVLGEHDIDEPAIEHYHDRIVVLSLVPTATIAVEAAEALKTADVIIFGPGDFYTSIIANTVVDGFREAIAVSDANLIFVANLMARKGQTIGMHLPEYLTEFERYVGCLPDIVIVPDAPLPDTLVARYAAEEAVHPILYHQQIDTVRIHRAPIVSHFLPTTTAGDVLARSLIRHDSDALAAALLSVLHS
jgi:uncharacterized cofD-like protein